MTEPEYDDMLETVAAVMDPASVQTATVVPQSYPALVRDLPRAANDNDDGPWPLIDFPDGWEASN